MKHWCIASLVAAGCILIASCATDEQRAIYAGAIQLSQNEIAKAFPGNTIRGEGSKGQFTNYYQKDGRKLSKEGDQVTTRRWWINDEGHWCETLFADHGRDSCNAAIYNHGHRLTWYSEKGAAIGSFSLVAGDPQGLEESYPKIRPANNSELPPADKLSVN